MLYSTPGTIKEQALFEWVEHSNSSIFRDKVLRRLHKDRLIEFDEAKGEAHISPSGIAYVEQNLPLDFSTLNTK